MAQRKLEMTGNRGAHCWYAASGPSTWGRNYYNISPGRIGHDYRKSSVSGAATALISYRSSAEFENNGAETEPEAADQSTGILTVQFGAAISGSATVGILSAGIASGAQEKYEQLGGNDNTLGSIGAGEISRSFNLTTQQLRQALAYGIKVFPTSEFVQVTSYTSLTAETSITCTLQNPASKGSAENVTPGNFASIIGTEDTAVGYTYRHDLGGYAQAFLGVRAVNADTGDVVTIAHKRAVSVADGGRGTFTIAAGTLTAGTWNITISAAPAAAENYYSDSDPYWYTGQTVTYTVRENSEVGNVSCDGRPIPLVSWTASSQAAYQVKFGDYDSGARAGAETSFIVPRIFPDGAYPVQVRTANSAGIWSDWTEIEYVTIRNVEPSITFSVLTAQNGQNILVRWVGGSGAENFAIMRDGKMIGIVGSSVRRFVDRIAASGTYEVLCVTSDRYYKPSGKTEARLNLAADLLSADGGYTWLAGKYTPDRKSQPEDVREDVSFVYYAGREKPIAYRTKQRSRTKSFIYVFKNRVPARTLRELVGSEVIVKTTRGEYIRGVIPEMSWGDARFASPSFQIREIWGEEDGLEYPT